MKNKKQKFALVYMATYRKDVFFENIICYNLTNKTAEEENWKFKHKHTLNSLKNNDKNSSIKSKTIILDTWWE